MTDPNSVCFVGRIESMAPIEGADRIVQAIISGWECVIPKDKYKIGDLLVIATTDAVIPVKMAEDLGVLGYLKHRKKTQQYTVKTTKLKGVYSTAMIVDGYAGYVPKEGDDMMKAYGITKYEEPEVVVRLSSGKKVRTSKHPDFHVYYKFPNIKNAPGMFNEEDDIKITRKIHGCNARYGIVRKPRITLWNKLQKWFGNKLAYYDYVYGSHQVEKGVNSVHFYDEDVWAKIGEKYNLESRLKEKLQDIISFETREVKGVIIYGEIYGQGIQKYYDYGLKGIDMKIFDVKLNDEYLPDSSLQAWSEYLGIPMVDKYYEGKYSEEEVKKWQYDGFIEGTNVPEEGVVVSSLDGNREKIAKFVNPAYLEFQSKKEDSTDFH